MNRLSRHVLAAYYNDARVNILYCLNDVREKTGLKPIAEEAHILSGLTDLKLTTTTPERQSERIKLLRSRFRFLDPATETKPDPEKPDEALSGPEHYERVLRWMFQLITDQRNALVHPNEPETPISHQVHKNLFYDLGKIYDGSLNEVAKRFSIAPRVIEPLRRWASPQRGQGQPKARLKPVESFSLAICSHFDTTVNRDDIRPSEVLHVFGQVLLCALFLDKTQIAELAGHFWDAGNRRYRTERGQRMQWTEQQQAILRELLGVYRVHMPAQRLQVQDTLTAVTLDTVSELSRCPRALFEALKPSDQARFRTGTPLLWPASSGQYEEEEDGGESWLLVRGRYDRFVPLMMRFLDFEPSNRLRFAVDLGQYFYNVRLKPGTDFADGVPRVRRLARKVIAYGRLADFGSAVKPASWQTLETNYRRSGEDEDAALQRGSVAIEALPPYVVPCEPHYHYSDDRIGVRLSRSNGPAAYPDLPIAPDHLDLKAAIKAGRPNARDMEPDFWASTDQLLDLGFYAYLQRRNGRFRPLHLVLADYREGMARLLAALTDDGPSLAGEPRSSERRAAAQDWLDRLCGRTHEDQTRLALTDLPGVVIQHLLGAIAPPATSEIIGKRLQSLIDETERRQRQIENLLEGFKKRGKKGFRPIKGGTIANFLSEDLLRFQRVDESKLKTGGGKLNSQQYQLLQAALAYYGTHLEEPPQIADLLRGAGLLDGKNAHPFLPKLGISKNPNKYPGLISFYQDYLKQRRGFLMQEQTRMQRGAATGAPPRWLRLRQCSSLKTWLAGYQRAPDGTLDIGLQPLPIPRNLLYPPLLAMVAAALGTTSEALREEGTRRVSEANPGAAIPPSVTWLLKSYLAHEGQAAQELYTYSRRYDLFDWLLDDRGERQRHQQKTQHFLNREERLVRLGEVRAWLRDKPRRDEVAKSKNQKVAKAESDKVRTRLSLYERQERGIARLMGQDMLLYLYARSHLDTQLLWGEGRVAPSWSLAGIAHTLLNTPIPYRLAVPGTQRALAHASCKIRNLGEMRLLARDKRLPSLFAYYPQGEDELDQAEVRAELASYRRARVQVMALIYKLEEAILARQPAAKVIEVPQELLPYLGAERHGRMLYLLYDLFQRHARTPSNTQGVSNVSDTTFALDNFDRARLIRNGLSHNQYPDAARFTNIVAAVDADPRPDNPALHRKVAERFVKLLEDLYRPWLYFLDSVRMHP